MEGIKTDSIPLALKDLPQWVLWKTTVRDGLPTKLPFTATGQLAKCNDPVTWCSFDDAHCRYLRGRYDGIGFVFAEHDPLCGIDLDGCRNPETGEVAEWARAIITNFDTYAEVSPSKTGVKLFVIGKWPQGGKKIGMVGAPEICGKAAAIEVYDRTRYFAVTGWRLRGPKDPQPRQEQLDALRVEFWPEQPAFVSRQDFHAEHSVIDRARKYLAKLPPAVSGQGGHNAAFHAACVLVLGFGLPQDAALGVLSEWNQLCQPPWSERELIHKIGDASRQTGERNYLRNVPLDKWDAVKVPAYRAPAQKFEPRITTLASAAVSYLDAVKAGKSGLIELGLGDLDYAIGGGVEPGEMVILAARPSHGKSAVALQCAHTWSAAGKTIVMISEEMSAMSLGKRTIQFASDVPQEHWPTSMPEVERDIEAYSTSHARCLVVECCGTADAAAEQIEKAVQDHKAEVAIVDYAQLLRSPGKSRYEQVTNTSIVLKQVAARHKILVVVLCQLNREIESRQKFTPVMSDLKDTGQLEQDADVIVFLVWPHRLDNKRPPHEFLFFVAKNRNRPIHQSAVTCEFRPSRQMIVQPKAVGVSYDEWQPQQQAF